MQLLAGNYEICMNALTISAPCLFKTWAARVSHREHFVHFAEETLLLYANSIRRERALLWCYFKRGEVRARLLDGADLSLALN